MTTLANFVLYSFSILVQYENTSSGGKSNFLDLVIRYNLKKVQKEVQEQKRKYWRNIILNFGVLFKHPQ